MSSFSPEGGAGGPSTEVAGEVPWRASSPLSEAGCDGLDGVGDEPGELDDL